MTTIHIFVVYRIHVTLYINVDNCITVVLLIPARLLMGFLTVQIKSLLLLLSYRFLSGLPLNDIIKAGGWTFNDIIKAGGWTNAGTFVKHYNKPIGSNVGNSILKVTPHDESPFQENARLALNF